MNLKHLRIENLRRFESLQLDLAPHWNLFDGANGAGKTTLLEAVYLLSHGRSFRTAARDVLIRTGQRGYSVYGEIAHSNAVAPTRVGVSRETNRFDARVDGERVTAASLLRRSAVICFEPGSHELISGGADERRRFLDWGVFHVEHEFLDQWRRYQRALKQRNAVLRGTASAEDLDLWDHELATAAEPLSAMRERYFRAWQPLAAQLLSDLLGELGEPQFGFDPGFAAEKSLHEVLAQRRGRDIDRGHTTAGPHRCDWSVTFAQAQRRDHLSRGEEKLCAFACVMAQGRLHAATAKEWPIICLDDIASEIDANHLRRVLDLVDSTGAQVLVTATQEPTAFAQIQRPAARFHVEQGAVTALL